jgi:hypothetical protein
MKQPSRTDASLPPALLACGVVAGPLYLGVGFAQAIIREGFDVRRHALSLLSNGELGWIQIANFVLCGLLAVLGALGLRPTIAGSRGGTWGPILLAVYGVGLIGAGVFVADPAPGFPPGTPAGSGELSRHGLLHFVFGALGFYALIGACFVFARRFGAHGQLGWTTFSATTGIGFAASFFAVASGSTSSATVLAFYAALTLAWGWHSAIHAKVLFEERGRPASAHRPQEKLS